MKTLKKIKSLDQDEVIFLFPHAGGYAEQLLTNTNINKSVYGIVYPESQVVFSDLCIWIANEISQIKISFKKRIFIGSSMGGYIAFLVIHFLEKRFGLFIDSLYIFSVACPEALMVKLKNPDIDLPLTKHELSTLKTMNINNKKISAEVIIYHGNDSYINISKAKEFWRNISLKSVKFIQTSDRHLPSNITLSNLLSMICQVDG